MWLKSNPALDSAQRKQIEHYLSLWIGDDVMRYTSDQLKRLGETEHHRRIEIKRLALQQLEQGLNQQSPEAITHALLSHWTIDTRNDAQIQERQAAVWCALLTPYIAQKKHSQHVQHLVPNDLVQMGIDWLSNSGYTQHTAYCLKYWALKPLAKHPPRVYQLCIDSAHMHNLNAAELLCSMVLPVMHRLRLALYLSNNTHT